jgi:hypothetical protein
VNISAVEEIQPLPTGEYRLRVKGGKPYLVTRKYKDNLRDLAQLWVAQSVEITSPVLDWLVVDSAARSDSRGFGVAGSFWMQLLIIQSLG